MDMMESAIGFCEGISQLAQRRQAYSEAWQRQRARCGSCQHWMKKPTCPRERGVRIGGPSADASPCDQFTGTKQHHQFVAAFQAMPRPQ